MIFGNSGSTSTSTSVIRPPHPNQMVQPLGLDPPDDILAPLGGIPPASCDTAIAVGCFIFGWILPCLRGNLVPCFLESRRPEQSVGNDCRGVLDVICFDLFHFLGHTVMIVCNIHVEGGEFLVCGTILGKYIHTMLTEIWYTICLVRYTNFRLFSYVCYLNDWGDYVNGPRCLGLFLF